MRNEELNKNGVHFINAHSLQRDQKTFGYLFLDNKSATPADKQIHADLFGECYAYHFGENNSDDVKHTRVETKHASKLSTTLVTKTKPARKTKPVQTVTWSDVTNDV